MQCKGNWKYLSRKGFAKSGGGWRFLSGGWHFLNDDWRFI
jgi:glucan-binding YG repeat protein